MPANLTTKLGQLVDVLTPDTTNTRIGVANASPTRTLDVTGTGAISTSLAIGGATIGTNALAVTGTTIISGNTGIGTTSPQTLLTLNAGSGNDGTGEATYHGLIELAGNYTGTSDLTTVSGIEWKTAYGSNGSGFRQTGLYNSSSGASTLVFAGRQASASWSTLMTLTGVGNLGIGMTPSNVLDITQNQNAGSVIKLLNNSAGANAQALVQLSDGTNNAYMAFFGTGGAGTGPNNPGSFSIQTQATGGMNIATTAAYPIKFHLNNAEAARFDTSGNLVVGTTSASARIHGQSSGLVLYMRMTGVTGDSFQLAQFAGDGGSDPHQFFAANTGGSANAAATLYKLGKASTSRSINAAGTINASGADYAEYMTKADACGAVAKGEIIGVNIDGKLTDKFSNSHSFVIKSTDPSYVGGDTWGVALDGSELEAARQKVDRIAFSGQVPVNVTGATVGDYIVPVAGPDGGIAGEAVTNPTFDQYRAAVGRVWKILEDGRAFVSVKVS